MISVDSRLPRFIVEVARSRASSGVGEKDSGRYATCAPPKGGTAMTNSRRDYVDLPGSERAAHPLATIAQPPVDPEEHATVTIVPATPAAIPAIIAFATENHLTTSIEHGFVKATGRLDDLQAAFDTQL